MRLSRSCFFFFISFTHYLRRIDSNSYRQVEVDLKELINYCILSAARASFAVRQIHDEHSLATKSKKGLEHDVTEVVTKQIWSQMHSFRIHCRGFQEFR